MDKRTTAAARPALLAAALLAVSCSESAGPEHLDLPGPLFEVTAGGGITLSGVNGTLGLSGRRLVKGFDAGHPRLGDAIIASFYWVGSTNIITSVTDHLTNSEFTPVGNTYTLVRYVTAGGISMATYVATNVQGFPDPPQGTVVLAVQANLADSVARGGVTISAWSGVEGVLGQALGDHRAASGSGSTETVAAPGAIPVNAGALVYGVTMADALVGHTRPDDFLDLGAGSDDALSVDPGYVVPAVAGSVNAQWRWFFSPDQPGTWLATVLALNPGAGGGGPGPTPGELTVTTSTSGLSLDLDGYSVMVDGGQTQAIGTSGSVRFTGLEAGDHTVVLSDVAVNCTVSGGDTRTVSVPAGGSGSTAFAVTCVPGPATQLVFTVQPSNAAPNATISPAVKVKAVDAQNHTVTDFTGPVTIAIGRNGSLLFPGTLSGTKTVTPVNGVATFSDLRIDKSGDGYTLRVTASGLTGAESASFNIRALVCVLGVCL